MTQRPPPVPAAGPARPMTRFLAADSGPLSPFDPAPLSADFAPVEAAALSAALGCPDLFLIHAPGHDRGKLAADLAAEAARTGSRVLVVAPGPTADAVVERLAELEDDVGRAVAPGEAVELLTRTSSSRTAAGLVQAALAEAARRTAQAVTAAEARLAELDPEGVTERLARIAADEVTVRATQERAEAEAARSEAVSTRRSQLAADRETATRTAAAARATAEAEVARLRAELDDAVCAAKKRHGAVGFLKGLFTHDDSGPRCADRQRRLAVAEEAVTAADRDEQAATDLEARHRSELEAFTRSEAHRRRTEADARLAELAAERGRLTVLEMRISAAAEAVRTARNHLVNPDAVATEALAQVNVVVGPAAAIGNDPLTLTEKVFDMLVVADAEHVTDPEIDAITHLAGRGVLIGDVGAPVRPGRPFARAWQRLHHRPFVVEGGRLIARLFDAPRADRLWAEPLADRPQVELRFARTPEGEVGVAEVAFPGNTPLTAVKAFLAAELGEVRLTVAGPLRWHEADDRWTACWPAFDGSRGAWADLGGGVRERVADHGPDAPTVMVSFDKSAGWDRDSAEAWVARHTAMTRAARTLALPRPVAGPTTPARVLAGVGGG